MARFINKMIVLQLSHKQHQITQEKICITKEEWKRLHQV